jgi:hypothetical protein
VELGASLLLLLLVVVVVVVGEGARLRVGLR